MTSGIIVNNNVVALWYLHGDVLYYDLICFMLITYQLVAAFSLPLSTFRMGIDPFFVM